MTFKRMLVLFATIVFLLGPMAPEAQAQRNPGSFGIGLGSATLASGLSLKQFAGPTAFQFTVGCWRSSCSNALAASLDFLVNMPAFSTSEFLSVAWNFGGGGALGIGDSSLGAAAAFVVGLEFNFQALPIDLVLEWRPGIRVVPDVGIGLLNTGAHLRLYLF
jgi:hypothetical protein